MKYELFNTTTSIREVPKYNYKGTITLQPKGTYPIEEFMTKFYLPYVPSGIVIRTTAEEVVENKETSTTASKKVVEKATEVKVDKVEEVKEDKVPETVEVEEVVDAAEVEAAVEGEDSAVKVVEEEVKEEAPKTTARKGKYSKK